MQHGGLVRRVAAVFLAALVAAGAAGCDEAESTQTGDEIVVTDAVGRTVTLPGVPERITVAGRAAFMIVDVVYLFEQSSDRLVGLEMGRESAEAFVDLIDPDLAGKTILAKNVGPEEIAATDPDLVIMKSYVESELGEPLERLGIPVLCLDLETPEQYERDIDILGTVLGERDRSAEVIAFYQDRVDRITSLTGDIADDARPRVLVLQYDASEGTAAFDVPPASWLQTQMVTMVGGSPVWTDTAGGSGWTRVGFEQIAAWDPDQIFIISYAGDSATVAENLETEPAWRELSAIQAGSVYGWPGDLSSWDQPDTRWILGLTWLFTKVQPALAREIDIMAETEALFTDLYRLTPELVRSELTPALFGSIS